jgi:hypothetical protein
MLEEEVSPAVEEDRLEAEVAVEAPDEAQVEQR